jgi:hypothetical protein
MARKQPRPNPGSFWPHDPLRPPPDIAHVLEVLMFRCAPDPWVIIGAAGFFALTGWWSVVSPNWKDAVKHGTGGSWIHNMRAAFADANEEAPSWYQKGTVYAFEFLEVSDFLAFWLMVGEAIGDSLIGATSLIWEFSPCNKPQNMLYYYSSHANCYQPSFLTWGDPFSWNQGDSNMGGPNLGTFFTVDSGATYRFGMRSNWVGFSNDVPRPMSTRLIDFGSGEVPSEHDWNPEHSDAKQSAINFVKPTTNFSGQNHTYHMQALCPINYGDIGSTCDGGQGRIALEIVYFPT